MLNARNIPHREVEEPTAKYIEEFSECFCLTMEGIYYIFDTYPIPTSCVFSFDLIATDKKAKKNRLYIHNFFVPEELRNQGLGTKLIKKTAKKIKAVNKGTKFTTISVSGHLTPDDHEYWKYSLPMYYRLSKRLMGHNIYCFANNTKTKSNEIVSTAEKLYSDEIPVNFEFRKK